MRLAVLVLAASLAGACATLSAPPTSSGAALYRAKCGACHLLPAPARFDRAGWERVLDAHRGRVPLDASQRAALFDHLAPAPTPLTGDRTSH